MATAQELYSDSVSQLPRSEQLRLAALILDDLSRSSAPLLDYSDAWTDEDIRDVTAFSLQQAAKEFPQE